MMSKSTLRAFTLIEMLVVLALIAILAAILFPVFSAVRAKARQSVCASNLRQIGMANALYLSDYDGHFAYSISNWTRTHNDYSPTEPFYSAIPRLPAFQDVLQPYCKSRAIFRCPSDTGSLADPSLKPTVYGALGISYDFEETLGLYSVTEARISKPANYAYVYDAGRDWHSYAEAESWDALGNILLLDGHVRFGLLEPFNGQR